MRTLTEEEFYEIFQPIPNKYGSDYWESHEIKGIPVEFVWAAMDGDDGGTVLTPGWHVVNVFGWMVTTMPWPTSDIEVHMDQPDAEDDYDFDNDDEDD